MEGAVLVCLPTFGISVALPWNTLSSCKGYNVLVFLITDAEPGRTCALPAAVAAAAP